MANDGTVKIGTELDKSGLDKGLSGLGGFAKKGAAVLAGTAAAGVAAFGAITKASLDAVAQMEQNVGGVETLFKDSAKTVIDNANKAYKTAGMSANKYMSTVTSFSASLLQSLSGNTEEAAKVADMAIVDMSDNANKMGTSMESIQDAYQGFAKQNYTMLDNLKLGYGGTKTEMQRLLKDTQKLTGVKYDINNLSDVYNAIHAIQEEMGITGTTAKEAGTTIEGSMNAAKAAWENFLVGTASAEELVEAVGVAAGNVGKNLAEIVPRLAETIPAAAGMIASAIVENLPQFADMGLQLLENVSAGILNGTGPFLQKGVELISGFAESFSSGFLNLISAGTSIITNLVSGLLSAMPQMISQAGSMLITWVDTILSGIPSVLTAGKNIISAVVDGIKENFPQIAQQALQIGINFISALAKNLPDILKAGAGLVVEIVSGILSMIPVIAETALDLGKSILDQIAGIDWIQLGKDVINFIKDGVNALFDTVPDIVKDIAQSAYDFFKNTDWVGMGKNLIQKAKSGIQNLFSEIPEKIKDIAQNAYDKFKNTDWLGLGKSIINKIVEGIKNLVNSIPNKLKSIATDAKEAFTDIDWSSIGENIISGIKSGISSMAKSLADSAVSAASSAVSTVKGWLGIHSPSRRARDEIGVNMIAGINEGIEDETPNLEKTSEDSAKASVNAMKRSTASDFVTEMQQDTYRRAENNEMSAREKARNNGYEPEDPDDDTEIVLPIEVNVDGEPLYKKTVRKTKESINREQRNNRAAKGDAVVFA